MPVHDGDDVTRLLHDVSKRVPGASDRLMALVYANLKAIARNRAAASSWDPQEPTALVHETYARMFTGPGPVWQNRHHFYWAASRAMRDILVERARCELSKKRGGHRVHVRISDELVVDPGTDAAEFLALDEAITQLEAAHPDVAHLVMLRFFAGLTRDQVCEVTGRNAAEVWRHWVFAKAWLLERLDPQAGAQRRVGARDS